MGVKIAPWMVHPRMLIQQNPICVTSSLQAAKIWLYLWVGHNKFFK